MRRPSELPTPGDERRKPMDGWRRADPASVQGGPQISADLRRSFVGGLPLSLSAPISEICGPLVSSGGLHCDFLFSAELVGRNLHRQLRRRRAPRRSIPSSPKAARTSVEGSGMTCVSSTRKLSYRPLPGDRAEWTAATQPRSRKFPRSSQKNRATRRSSRPASPNTTIIYAIIEPLAARRVLKKIFRLVLIVAKFLQIIQVSDRADAVRWARTSAGLLSLAVQPKRGMGCKKGGAY